MPKYLFKSSYTATGAQGIHREGGTARRAAVEKAIQGAGGKLEAFYFAFGDVDAYVIADLPDNVAAATLTMAVAQSGASATRTVVLVTPEEIDAAVKKNVSYRPPGA